MIKNLKRTLLILGLLFFLVILSVVSIVIKYRQGDVFHPASTKRQAVWFSKRVVAQACSYVFAVWDPYASQYRDAVYGPQDRVREHSQSKALETGEALQKFFDHSSVFQGAQVKIFLNGELPESRFRFYYQSADESKLDSLRKLYSPAGMAVRGEDDYQALAGLSCWLFMNFRRHSIDTKVITELDFNFNALDILYRLGKGERFWCSEYATTLVQSLASLGFTSRYVMLNSKKGGHVVCEAWSESFGKWIMLDPFYCWVVTLDQVPLNVYEIHRLLADPQAAARAVVLRSGEELAKGHRRSFYLSLFENFAVRMRNDWFTNRFPHWYPLSNSVMNAVEWQDELTEDNIYYRNETDDLKDLYWPLNRTRVTVVPGVSDQLSLRFDTFTPNFSHFLLGLDNSPPNRLDNSRIDWRLKPGLNMLRVAAVNRWGIVGRDVHIEIEWNDGKSK
jgi:hypothetical protein